MGLRDICELTVWAVQAKTVYGPQLPFRPYASSLDLPVLKLHMAQKSMFYLLYYTKPMDLKYMYCFNTSTSTFINKQMLNNAGLKSLPFLEHFKETKSIV